MKAKDPFIAYWHGEPWHCWKEGANVTFKRPTDEGEVWRSLPRDEFRKWFSETPNGVAKPIEPAGQKPEDHSTPRKSRRVRRSDVLPLATETQPAVTQDNLW